MARNLGLAFSATVVISASYMQVLRVCVSTLLYLFSVCPFCVRALYCSSLAFFSVNLIDFSVLPSIGFLLIPLHYCPFSVARSSNMHPQLIKGFYNQYRTSSHLSLIKWTWHSQRPLPAFYILHCTYNNLTTVYFSYMFDIFYNKT